MLALHCKSGVINELIQCDSTHLHYVDSACYILFIHLFSFVVALAINGTCLSNSQSDLLSTLFDVGGIAGQ